MTGPDRRKNKSKDSKSPTATSASTTVGTTAASASNDAHIRRAPAAQTQPQVPYTIFLIFALVPILKLLFSTEAPQRPFSLAYPPPSSFGLNGVPVANLGDADGTQLFTEPRVIRPKIMLVTAHPGDEVLFAPTLLALSEESRKDEVDVWVLTLNGGADVEAQPRQAEELTKSLDVLRVREERRIVVNDPILQDNTTLKWNAADVARVLEPYVLEHKITTILTFDNWGVTNHPNHYAIPFGVETVQRSISHKAAQAKKSPKKKLQSFFSSSSSASSEDDADTNTSLQLYVLTSTHWNQHLGPLSPIIAQLSLAARTLFTVLMIEAGFKEAPSVNDLARKPPPVTFVSDVNGWWEVVKAARAHASLWAGVEGQAKGWAALGLGRYFWVNEWELVVKEIPERKFQTVGDALASWF